MASTDIAVHDGTAGRSQERVVNDFSIQVATVNGSGSQSANTVLLRTIFQMGVPVSGKNLFPSNIAGLPTWYTIRASKNGFIARKKEIDFLVAMNAETAKDDVLSLAPGAVVLYDEPLNLKELRSDLIFYAVPYDKLVGAVCPEAKLRKLVKNMIYVGVVAQLLSSTWPRWRRRCASSSATKKKAADLNLNAAQAGYDYAASTLTKQDPFFVERMDKTTGKIIIDGNAASALGSMFAGVTVVTWYPITPSSSLVESLIEYMKEHRIGPDGKATFAVVQAEDELASIGMALGAGWAGARCMTATAGPGISLMSEFAGLGYYVEIPAVIWDVQRVGPSTGLPTRTSQGDMLSVAFLSHGDTKHPMLIPCSVTECFTMAPEAFDLAEYLQTPVFIMSDLDLGMNNWMVIRSRIPRSRSIAARYSPRKISSASADLPDIRTWMATLLAIELCRAPIIPPQHGLLAAPDTTRRRSIASALTTTSTTWTDSRESLRTRENWFPSPSRSVPDRRSASLPTAQATGQWSRPCINSRASTTPAIDYLRLRAYPFTEEVLEFVKQHETIYVVDQNRDGQMYQLLTLDLPNKEAAKLRSIRHYNGLPVDARSITDDLIRQEGK